MHSHHRSEQNDKERFRKMDSRQVLGFIELLGGLEDGLMEVCRDVCGDDPSIDYAAFRQKVKLEVGRGMLLAKQALEVLELIEQPDDEIEFVDREPLDGD